MPEGPCSSLILCAARRPSVVSAVSVSVNDGWTVRTVGSEAQPATVRRASQTNVSRGSGPPARLRVAGCTSSDIGTLRMDRMIPEELTRRLSDFGQLRRGSPIKALTGPEKGWTSGHPLGQ
jgi:hypothetical protein